MKCLVDTNVLLRSVQLSHPMSSAAAGSIDSFLRNGETLVIMPQNVTEFWCVATRPEAVNGLGLSVAETAKRIKAFRNALVLLPETERIFEEWEQLVAQHQVAGKRVYDARLVAAMKVHNVTHLLTFNTDDFKSFSEITAVNPINVS
jgi:predicted nucleic acid-binding protein